MSEVERIVDELTREHEGDPWHGSPLATLLDGVTAQQAAKIVPGGHSIWQIVLHITSWKNEVRRRVEGMPAAEPQEGDWPDVGDPSPERWQEARTSLNRAHQQLLAAVRTLPESRLHKPTKDPRNRALGVGVSLYVTLHGLAQHDAYHAGQIALLKRTFD
jgi:uncharacterized damage-inducible protein DinB